MTEDDDKPAGPDALESLLPRRSSNPSGADPRPSFRVPRPADAPSVDDIPPTSRLPSLDDDPEGAAADFSARLSSPPPKSSRPGAAASSSPTPAPASSVAMTPMRIIEVKGGAKGPPPAQWPQVEPGVSPQAAEVRLSPLPPSPHQPSTGIAAPSSPNDSAVAGAAAGLSADGEAARSIPRVERATPREVPVLRGSRPSPEGPSGASGGTASGGTASAGTASGGTASGGTAAAEQRAFAAEQTGVLQQRGAAAQTQSADAPSGGELEGLEVDDEVGLSLEPVPTPPSGVPAVTEELDDHLELIGTGTELDGSHIEDIGTASELDAAFVEDITTAPELDAHHVEDIENDDLTVLPLLVGAAAVPNPAPPRPARRGGRPDMSMAPEADRRRQWWEELFTEEFARASVPLTSAQFAVELDFIEESLGLEHGAKVLDLACGDGRYAAGLAQRGLQAVGLDYSQAMLSRAGERALEHPGVEFVRGDMRELPYREVFDGIICWNASFGYFDEEKNIAVLESAFAALKPGGAFLLDVPNRDMVAVHQPSQTWFEGEGCVCMDDMHLDFITSRMFVKRTMMLDDGRNREFMYAMRLYGLHELGRMLHHVGFRVVEVTGQIATPGVFFGASSPRIIVLVNKP